MSIESATSRIRELEARLEMLNPPSPEAPRLAAGIDAMRASTAAPGAPPFVGPQPFDVALASKLGQASLRPLDGKLPASIDSLVEKYAGLNKLDPKLVRAVITAESDGDPKCTSNKGAKGLMQLMPDELKEYGVTDPFDPEQSIRGGTQQLANKLRLFNGDVQLALAAYNAGTGNVRRYNGIPPFPETQSYVRKVMGLMGR